jgi:hypothetical protein
VSLPDGLKIISLNYGEARMYREDDPGPTCDGLHSSRWAFYMDDTWDLYSPGVGFGEIRDHGLGCTQEQAEQWVLHGTVPGEQPQPKPNDLPAVWDLVKADMTSRDTLGKQRYGTRLQPHNGRDVLRDAYEEALDLTVYLRQAIFERDGR